MWTDWLRKLMLCDETLAMQRSGCTMLGVQAVGITFLGAFQQEDRDWEWSITFLKVPDRWSDADLHSPSLTHDQIQDLMTDLNDGMEI